MNTTSQAVAGLAALAHEHRLNAFRLLVREGPEGLPAGRIALRLGIPSSTLSTHLAQLERAGLLRAWRVRQRIHYAVDIEGTRGLVEFLLQDCCRGRPEICGYSAPSDLRHRTPDAGKGSSAGR